MSEQQRGAERLRGSMAALRLRFTWLGVRKTLSTEQRAQAAETFGAHGEYLSAGKKLLDTRHRAYREVTAVRNRAVGYWKSISLPFPEAGIRLVKHEELDEIRGRLARFREELAVAVAELDADYSHLRRQARQRLGELYDPADYPQTLVGLFGLEWDFPSVEPPEYLRRLSPRVYEEECRRVAARFDEAVQLAEAAFTEELSKLVTHLAERLCGSEDGRPKVFRDSAVENLAEFFERFRKLSLGSNEELDRLVAKAQRIVRGVRPQELRDSAALRGQVAGRLAQVTSALDAFMVERPRRALLRPQRHEVA